MPAAVFRHQLNFRKKIISEKRSRQAARRKLVEDLKVSETRENQAILRQVLSQYAELSAGDIDLLVIPSGHSAVSTLPDDRIRNYTRHLQQTISEATAYADASQVPTDEKARQQVLQTAARFSENPALRIISDRLCGMCKGGCCTAGGDTAYINVHMVRRFMDEHPDLSPNQVLQAYLSAMSSQTVTSACINQTEAGCALPREMRSETCNGYYCDSLQNWHERSNEQRSSTVLAIQRTNSNWHRFDLDRRNTVVDVALIRASGVVPVSCNVEQTEATS